MNKREGKRPRITRSIGNRDEKRWSGAQEPSSRNRKMDRDDRYSGRTETGRHERPAEGERKNAPTYHRNTPSRQPSKSGRYDRDGQGERNFNRHDYGQDRSSSYGNRRRDERDFDSRNEYRHRNDSGERRNNRSDQREDYNRRPERRTPGRYPERDYNRGEERRSYDRSGENRRPAYGERSADQRYRQAGREEPRRERYQSAAPVRRREERPFPIDLNSQYSKKKQINYRKEHEMEETELRLNRYIAKGGLCSRRDADTLIQEGRVKVNGVVVQQVGVKVNRKDVVEVDGVRVVPEKKVYILLNKPKDYVTTVEDPLERKTVMSLIEGACKERVYPIGRLDRQTTGVLLFTNDGDLAKKLTHPKYNQKKIYHVFLDRVLQTGDIEKIRNGIELEDGFIQADDIQFASDDRTQVGIEIHSGKNRIVRRIFEHLGYHIFRLDRVYFAGITKKNLPRGKWRFLTPEEVEIIKFY